MEPKTKADALYRIQLSEQAAEKHQRAAQGCRGNADGRRMAARFQSWADDALENAARLRSMLDSLPE